MKKTLLSLSIVLGLGATALAQTYTPAAGSPLADGNVGTAYSQTINAAIPTTVNITGQEILDRLPAQAQMLAAVIDANASYPITITSTVLSVSTLPAGLTEDCNGCTVLAGATEDIEISGTPTAGGNFVIDITSETTGSTTVDVPFIGTQTLPFGGSFQGQQVPTLPGLMDSEGYTMDVAGTSGIEEANNVFSLGLYPNPTEGTSVLNINSTLAGSATIEVYSITGSLVQNTVKPVRVGANRLSLDLSSVPAGIYLVKADINGHQALVRTQKK